MALNQSWMLLVALGVAIILITVVSIWLGKRKRSRVPETGVANLDRLTDLPEFKTTQGKYRLWLGLGGGLLAVLIMISMVISSQPVTISTTSQTKYNRDIVLCLDVSGSMVEVDKELVEKFHSLTEEFQGERISLVIWNSKSFMVFPLTDDYEYIQDNLNNVARGLEVPLGPGEQAEGLDIFSYTVDDSANGSLIGDGLTACTLGFDQDDSQEPRSKSIILATDNVVNGQQIINFDEAVQYATDNEITIYGIKPFTGYEEGNEGEAMQAAIEQINGGKYYTLTDPGAVAGIVNEISQEEATALESDPILTKTPAPQLWIGLAGLGILGFLVLAWRLKV